MREIQTHVAVIITCVLCITLLEVVALCLGIDGKLFAIALGGICGLGGFTITKLFDWVKK